MKVLVAGATGAMGKQLLPRLVADGHYVVGITRSEAKLGLIRDMGATGVVGDVLDPDDVARMVAQVEPEVIIHQLTALDDRVFDTRHFDRTFHDTNRLRTEATDHLLAAGRAVGVKRFIAQSYAGWPFERTGGPVKSEDDPLDPAPSEGDARVVRRDPPCRARGDRSRVDRGHRAPLRRLLRPRHWAEPGGRRPGRAAAVKRKFPVVGDGGGVWSFVHIEDAADATVAAVTRGRRGVYNIVDDDPAPVRRVAARRGEGRRRARRRAMCRGGWVASSPARLGRS